MVELIKKTLLTGVGLAAMTKEKVEEIAKEFAKQAQLSSEKGKAFVDEVVAKSEKARKDLEATVQKKVSETLKQANVATHEDVVRLTERIEQLEKALNAKG